MIPNSFFILLVPPVFPGNCLYLHETFGVLGIRGIKLLLKDFQAPLSVSWDQEEGIAQNLGIPARVSSSDQWLWRCLVLPALTQPHHGHICAQGDASHLPAAPYRDGPHGNSTQGVPLGQPPLPFTGP